ncbi:MAG: sigma-70 family RNA polymerase sigma factor [Actinomycetota bacterium]
MDRALEASLVERLLQRDEDALRTIMEDFGPLVFGMARRVIADPSLAEEVAQDTFLALWRRPGAFHAERGTLQAFLLGVARNKAIDRVRKEQASRWTRDSLRSHAMAASGEGLTDERIEGVEDREGVRMALEKLSGVQREAIVLAYFGGRTYREVATELEIPEGTAKTRLRDGLIKLRELMTTTWGRE